MRRGWDEIRRQAKAFAEDWADETYESGEAQTFYNEFFQIFGVPRRQVASFEKRVENLDKSRRGFIDVLWPGTFIAEHKSAGLDLGKATSQMLDYFDWLPDRDKPQFTLTCDFQRWRLTDMETGTETRFTLSELPKHIEHFAFILGRRRSFGTQAAVNIKAAELMGALHDALEADNYVGHDLERLLVRLLFCLFADDTGIFEPKDIFLQLIEEDTAEDGGNVGPVLNQLFDILDTPEDKRQPGLSAELRQFPYVNGELFAGAVRTPVFDSKMRTMLLDCARFDWGKVSPAIFGSLFQSVMEPKERRAKGAHYTSETNIMKVIGPLFLDDLREEFERLRTFRPEFTGRAVRTVSAANRTKLLELQRRLRRLTFFDPACGCGNFLVIAYRELRRLELDILRELYADEAVLAGFDAAMMSQVNVDQFFGIELLDFPAEIAKVAMWMADHIANRAFDDVFGTTAPRIPLKVSASILNADALEAEWGDLLPAAKCHYVLGNPPFVGAKLQTPEQRAQVRLLARLGGSGGTLDYVAGWFIKAGAYVQANRRIRIAFVATNSITQGDQVAQLWPILFDRYALEITFAHRTFQWDSEARGKAHVHVVIIGLTHRDAVPEEKRLFSYADIRGEPVETRHNALTAYLFDARTVANRHLVVASTSAPLSGAPELRYGSQPIDGGHLILDAGERAEFIKSNPSLKRYVQPFIGAEEYINGGCRWILAFQGASPSELRVPAVKTRLARVRESREASQRPVTRELAKTPTAFAFTTIPTSPFLVVPEVSSERRDYAPIGWLEPPVIPSNLVRILPDATLWHFAIMTSHMHMAWLRHIGGRLESRYRYSTGLVYNTFPWPDESAAQRKRIEGLAQAVLDARGAHPTASLADLYDPDFMPGDLRKAHAALDAAVDRLYRPAPFAGDRERVEHLFGRYEALVNPLEHEGVKQVKRITRKAARTAGN